MEVAETQEAALAGCGDRAEVRQRRQADEVHEV